MSLVTADEVRQRMFLQNLPEITSGLGPVIAGAQAQVESKVGCKFTQGTSVETFFPVRLTQGKEGSVLFLRLRYGLVRTSPAPALTCSSGSGFDGSEFSDVLATEFSVEYEKGRVVLSSTYEGKCVRVDYGYGFAVNETAPEWLKEAIILQAIINAATHPITQENKGYRQLLPQLATQIRDLIGAHARPQVSTCTVPAYASA